MRPSRNFFQDVVIDVGRDHQARRQARERACNWCRGSTSLVI
jgi:hypothetical protein